MDQRRVIVQTVVASILGTAVFIAALLLVNAVFDVDVNVGGALAFSVAIAVLGTALRTRQAGKHEQ